MDVNKYILDASVILKWFLQKEDDFDQAMHFYEDLFSFKIEAHVPQHCYTEVMNILLIKEPNIATDVLSQLHMARIFQHRLRVDHVLLASQLMDQFSKIAFYDAAYHALALDIGAVFVTADENYYKKTSKAGNILLLKNYA